MHILLEHNNNFTVSPCGNRGDWLKQRTFNPDGHFTLGGSDAACFSNKGFRSVQELFDEKRALHIGAKEPTESPDNYKLKRGRDSEPHIRELFRVEHPEYDVYDGTGFVLYSTRLPFASASLDGILVSAGGRLGVLEIKSCDWSQKWKGEYCPDDYFLQVLHYLMVTGYDFAWLVARIIGQTFTTERRYYFDRNDPTIKEQLYLLEKTEREFVERVEMNRRPNFVIPI